MLKRIALFSLLFTQCALSFAQKSNVYVNSGGQDRSVKDSSAVTFGNKNTGIVKPSRDFVMVQLGYNTWASKPDSVKTKGFGYVFNAYLCYDFPIKKSNMSFAAGLGINTSVVYLDKQMLVNTDTGSVTAARIIADPTPGKRYKVNTTYLQAPFELRYFSNKQNRNMGFKAAVGVTVGAFLGAHTKELTSVGGINVKYKENTKRYYSPWNFAATARIGWGNMSVFGSYNITNVFKENNGPALTPASVGFCITGL